MDRFADWAAGLLEHRFILNALLPVIVFFGGYVTLWLWATHRLTRTLLLFEREPLSAKILWTAAYLVLTWFSAAFLASQWRNLVQFYEGYFFVQFRWLQQMGVKAHKRQRDGLREEGREIYIKYPRRKDVLPTRLGNVLRAAERYPSERYGADYLLLWTRLGNLCPEAFVANMEQFRSSLEFLVVVATGFGTFAIAASLTVALTGHGAELFLLCLVGGFILAYVAYLSAVRVAEEYGHTMRASFDLYRYELLVRLRWPLPATPEEEEATWRDVSEFIRQGAGRRLPYGKAYVEIDPTHLL